MPMITVKLGEQTVETHSVDYVPFEVGRDASCDVTIDNLGVSGKHCRFVVEDGRFKVEDMGSTNGTLLNGETVKSAEIKDGDEVRIGKFSLAFHRAEGEALPPSKDDAQGLADVIESAVTGEDEKKTDEKRPALIDKTFSMSAKDIRAAAERQPGSQRAAGLAKSLGGGERSGLSRGMLLVILASMGIVIVTLVVLVVLLAVR